MARGQVFTQPNQTGQIIETTSREEMNSVAILNPNDGVVYLKLNGPAGSTPSQWDWKLPSQSYGLFPGPWVSLGVYYLDQSGSGRSGELNVYDATDKLYTPDIKAIGRAVQAAGTTVDISQGTQPQNPPASSARLWVDGSGHLHVLQSNGSDFLTIDANNYASVITLLGDVTGPVQSNIISNLAVTTTKLADNAVTTIKLATASVTGLKIADGSITSAKINPNTLDLRPQGFSSSDIISDRGNGTGVLFLDASGVHYLFWNGTNYIFGNPPGGISVGQVACTAIVNSGNSTITGGTIYLNDVTISRWNPTQLRIYGGGGITLVGDFSLESPTAQIVWGSTGALIRNSAANIIANAQFHATSFMADSNFYYFASGQSNISWNGTYLNHSHSIQFNTSGNQVIWSNGSYISGNAGYVQGSKKELKEHIEPFGDELCIQQVSDPRMRVVTYDWPDDNRKSIGFTAEDVGEVLPRFVINDEDELPAGYVPQELTAILWGAVRNLNDRLQRIESI